MNFQKTDLQTIAQMRDAYLKSLPEFQELYLEIMVGKADYYILKTETQTAAGYAIVTKENILVEFYLLQKFVPVCSDIFQVIVNKINIQSIYCKSFDALLLNCCIINNYPYQLLGAHYREFYYTEIIETNGYTIRFAEPQDYPFLLQQEGELYETPEELDTFIKGRNVLMFQKDGCL